MSRRERETELVIGGGSSSGSDGLHSIGRGGSGNGSQPEAKDSGNGTGSSAGAGKGTVSQTSWFAPVEDDEFVSDCPGGVCPVPWASKDNPVFTIEGRPTIAEDTVNHPSHYTDGGIECIEAIEAALTIEEFRGYCKANCMKYIWRERHKGGTESLKKARWYLDRLIGLDEIQNG